MRRPWRQRCCAVSLALIAHFHSLKVRTRQGKLIVIAEAASADYAGKLRELGSGLNPELIVLNSSSDAEKNPKLQEEMSHAMDLCAEGQHCIAVIPSWVSGDERVATQMFLNFLVSSGGLW